MHDMNKDIELLKYRFSLAEETYKSAKMCFDHGFYRDCINRSYYAVFYGVRAVLALESIDFKRHKDVVAYFNKEFVATGKFPGEMGRRLARLKMKREESDYNDFCSVCDYELLLLVVIKGYDEILVLVYYLGDILRF